MRVRRLLTATVTIVAMTAVAGCGGEETAAGTGSGASADSQAGGAYGDAEALLRAMTAALESHETARISVEMAGGGGSAEGAYRRVGDRVDLALQISSPQLGEQPLEVRVVDGNAYLSMPPKIPAGKFVEIPDVGGGMFGAFTQADPMEALKAMKGAELEFLGTEQVEGVSTDHYQVTLKRAATTAPAANAPTSYEVWVDQEDLLRRMKLGTAAGEVTLTMSQWGEPVDIAAPAPGDILDMPAGAL